MPPEKEEHDDPSLQIAILRIVTELSFTILPFVIVAIVLSYRGTTSHVIYIPEWAIAATVLEGLVLVKFISAMFILVKEGGTKKSMSWGGFIFTLLLMVCFVPTVLILVFIFLEPQTSLKLAIAQIVAFIVAVLVFFFGSLFLEAVTAEPQPAIPADIVPNKSLDASGGSVFRIMTGAAKGALIRAAASTQTLCSSHY